MFTYKSEPVAPPQQALDPKALDVIKKSAVYSAHFLQKLAKLDLSKVEAALADIKLSTVEDQINDLWTLLDNLSTNVDYALTETNFGGALYWKDQEVQVTKLYLQDLIFEQPDEDPAKLAESALAKAKLVVNYLKQVYEET
jgi:phage tail tube protein FII